MYTERLEFMIFLKSLFPENNSFLGNDRKGFQCGFWCTKMTREAYLELFYMIMYYYVINILIIVLVPFVGYVFYPKAYAPAAGPPGNLLTAKW